MDNRLFVLFGILLSNRYTIDQLDTIDDRTLETLTRFCWRTTRFFDNVEQEVTKGETRRDVRPSRVA